MYDVLIVGAGPTGLVLALWLTKQGQRVRVIDKALTAGTASRAMVVHARTLELYQQLDLTEKVIASGYSNFALNLWVGGKKRASISLKDAGAKRTPYPFVLVYPQDQHEQMLTAELAAMGVVVEHDTQLLDFEDCGDHVVARLALAKGVEQTCTARYLAGCDGASSTTRHVLGLGFQGGTYKQVFYVADVVLEGIEPVDEVHVAIDRSDFVAVFPYGKQGRVRLIGVVSDLNDEELSQLSFEDVSQVAIARLGIKVISVAWFSTYKVHHRVTEHFRRGNVFLLGDAAHIHSPAGGQGMNTGIGDAINLAWKLTAVLKQQAPDALLDSYDLERKAFAYKLVATTDRIFSFVTADSDFANFVRTQIAPLFLGVAYRIEHVREYVFKLVSQTMLEYCDSLLSVGQLGSLRAGERLPWVTGEQDNYALLKQITWQIHVYGVASAELKAWCEQQQIPVYVFNWLSAHHDAGLMRDALYLLRPDTYIAFINEQGDVQAVREYFVSQGYHLRQ